MKEKPHREIPEDDLEKSEVVQLTEQQLADIGFLKESQTPEEIALIKNAIEKGFEVLSSRERKILEDYYLNDMSLDEIAESLSLSRGLIRETREKALKKVETRLTKQIRKTR